MEHRQRLHDALPRPNHDESARQDFVASLRQYSGRVLGAANYKLYKAKVEPAFDKARGRPPASVDEVRPLMTAEPYYPAQQPGNDVGQRHRYGGAPPDRPE